MTMTMFGVKVEEGKEGKNGQPSICLVYRHPISKIGLLQLILICVQLGDSLGNIPHFLQLLQPFELMVMCFRISRSNKFC